MLNRFVACCQRNPAATGVVAANLVPVVGVLFFGWDAFTVVFLYWLENGVIGFCNVLKMALAQPEGATMADFIESSGFGWALGFQKEISKAKFRRWKSQQAPNMPGALKFFLIPFFIMH